jgi:hypothetical protein
MKPRRPIPILLITGLLLSMPVTSPSLADTMEMPYGRPRHHQGPPPEFLEACRDLEVGDAVTLETPGGEQIEATCEQEGDQLIARPVTPPSQVPEQ